MAFRRDDFDHEKIQKQLARNLRDFRLVTRPNAGNGFWIVFLIPFAYFVNVLTRENLHFEYKLNGIVAFTLMLQAFEIFIKFGTGRIQKRYNFSTKLIPGLIGTFLVRVLLKQHIQFCLISGFFPCFVFNGLYLLTLRKLPKSFTLGELGLVLQAYVIFLYNSFIQVPYYYNHPPYSVLSQMTAILQVGLLGVSVIMALTFLWPIFRKTSIFYCLLVTIILTVMSFPVTRELPIKILLKFIFAHSERLFATSYVLGLVGLTGGTVWWFVVKKKASSTAVRKIFHLMIVLVYVPGLIYECTYLFVASGILFAIFIMLETMRLIEIYPFAPILNEAVKAFIDEKDAGKVVLTPIYLLAGCSMPFWLCVCPCDVMDSSVFEFLPLAAGILSVGIGDAVASLIGSMYGKHKWNGLGKSMEGTAANILSQIFAIIVFSQIGLVELSHRNVYAILAAVALNAILETTTDQVDNLVVPIVAFIFLSMS